MTVEVTGKYLDGVTSVTLGTAPNVLNGGVTANTPTSLTFTLQVLHGAPLGAQRLSVTTAKGTASFPSAVTITQITAAPNGNDKNDTAPGLSGTDENPFRSLAKALSIAGRGDTVFLRNGTYDLEHGDTFARITDTNRTAAPNVPDGLTINGESAAATKLVGAANGACDPTNSTAFTGLSLAGDAQIEKLDLSGFCNGILARSGTVTAKNVIVHDTLLEAIRTSWFESDAGSSTIVLEDVNVHGARKSAIVLRGNGSATVTNGRLFDNLRGGITAYNNGSLTVTGTEIDRNSSTSTPPRDEAGIYLDGLSSATITQVNVHDNDNNAIVAGPTVGGPTLTISNSTVTTGNAKPGLWVKGTWLVTARGSTFGGVRGIQIGDGLLFDFGRPGSPGRNTFNICAACDAIYDDRSAGRSIPITVGGNTWTSSDVLIGSPSGGCSAADTPSTQPRFWQITSPGTCSSSGGGTGNVVVNDL